MAASRRPNWEVVDLGQAVRGLVTHNMTRTFPLILQRLRHITEERRNQQTTADCPLLLLLDDVDVLLVGNRRVMLVFRHSSICSQHRSKVEDSRRCERQLARCLDDLAEEKVCLLAFA